MNTFYTMLTIIFIIVIFCSILSFKSLSSWNNFTCKAGLYSITNPNGVTMCKGKFKVKTNKKIYRFNYLANM